MTFMHVRAYVRAYVRARAHMLHSCGQAAGCLPAAYLCLPIQAGPMQWGVAVSILDVRALQAKTKTYCDDKWSNYLCQAAATETQDDERFWPGLAGLEQQRWLKLG
jgi:hypothetical protein